MKKKKKIAVFGVKTVPYTGGIENVVENTLPFIKGYEIIIYVRKKYFNSESLPNVRLICLPHINGKTFEAFSHTAIAFFHALLIEKANIFFFHAVVLGLFTPLPRFFGKKVLLQTHGLDWKREKWGRFSKLMIQFSTYLAAKIPHKTICVGKTDQEYFNKKYTKKKFSIVGNGVNIPDFKIDNEILTKLKIEKTKYILFMARLVPEKGAYLLIESFSKLVCISEYSDIKLVIAGDTNYHDEYYNSLVKQKSENIKFPGFVNGNDKYNLLRNAYVFVQPSTIEGMSTGVLEAMAMGVTSIVSDIKENTDIIGEYGLSFKSNCVEDLKNILLHTLKNEYQYQSVDYKEKMQNYIGENFTWQNTIEKLQKIIDNI